MNTVHLYVFDSMSDWEIGYAAVGINKQMFQALSYYAVLDN